MPYLSRAERERAEFRTPAEAIVHICIADGCSQDDARDQFAKALLDAALWARWGDVRFPDRRRSRGPRGAGLAASHDPEPYIPAYGWTEAKVAEVDWEDGTAVDAQGRRRPLLVREFELVRLWPSKHRDLNRLTSPTLRVDRNPRAP
jgi:hypothetical protein